MAEVLMEHAGHQGLDAQPMLGIGLRADGERTAELVKTYNPHTEIAFTSNGVVVVIQKDQLERLRGTVVDFKSSAFDSGVVIRLPGE